MIECMKLPYRVCSDNSLVEAGTGHIIICQLKWMPLSTYFAKSSGSFRSPPCTQMCVILHLLVLAPLNPRPMVDHFRESHLYVSTADLPSFTHLAWSSCIFDSFTHQNQWFSCIFWLQLLHSSQILYNILNYWLFGLYFPFK